MARDYVMLLLGFLVGGGIVWMDCRRGKAPPGAVKDEPEQSEPEGTGTPLLPPGSIEERPEDEERPGPP